MQIFPESLSKLWSLWEIRVMVLSSLILQGVLIFFGSRRKYSTSKWLRFLWLAYLSADWVATVSLSLLSGNSTNNATASAEPNQIITAFWAPFLLLHLGGPDTITAYSLEDNELWWRHLLVLVVQVALAIYVLVTAWVGHALNFLAIPMYVSGILKFGERTWVFRCASSRHFRDSMFRRPDPGPNYARFMDDFRSKTDEGFEIKLEKVIEAPTRVDYSLTSTAHNIFPGVANLQNADVFFQIFKHLFADLIISIHDILNSQYFFQNRSWDEAYQVIEFELGFIYDLFYTKAALYTVKGIILRFLSSVSIISVAVIFMTMEKQDYKKANIMITYMLLGGAIILEVYAVILLLRSNWSILWLSKYMKAMDWLYPVISFAQNKRWSNVMKGYNLVNVCLEYRPRKCSILNKDPWRSKKSISSKEVPKELKQLIFEQLVRTSKRATTLESCKQLCAHRGDSVLKNEGLDELCWSIEEEFDQSILLWHIATDLCYISDLKKNSDSFNDPNRDSDPENNSKAFCYPKCDFLFGSKGPKCDSDLEKYSKSNEASKLLSEYMLYLLVMRPFMLPNGIAKIRFQDTCAEATQFFEQRKGKGNHIKACQELLKVSTEIPPASIKGDRSKSLLFDACRLAKQLQSLETDRHWTNHKKWEMMRCVWVEILSYAACQCPWNPHARQLAEGGELLTHVWFLMAHLGITEQRQKGHPRSMFNVR